MTRRIVAPSRGGSIFVSYGDAWRRQHKAIVPVFQHRGILAVAPAMTDAAADFTRKLADRTPAIVDVYPEMIRLTCDIICDTALSGREQVNRGRLVGAVDRFLGSVSRLSLLDLAGAPAWIPRPASILDRSRSLMERMMDGIIVARIARGPGDPPDLLDMLIASTKAAEGGQLSLLEVRNNLLAFLIAGHETTALALTWSLYLLAFDRSVQLRARDVVRSVLGTRPATAEDLPRLGYVRQIIDEAMRLYPPPGLITRTAQAGDELGGRQVARGDTIIVPIYTLHRHHKLWHQPDRFDPSRFAPELAKARHRYSFIPFGGGPRICVGMSFAYTEMVIILATLLARFDLRLVEGTEPRPEMLLTLRPTGGAPLRVTPLG